MDLEKQVRKAILAELTRQASARADTLKVVGNGRRISIDGEVDLDELTMAVVGSVAGGP